MLPQFDTSQIVNMVASTNTFYSSSPTLMMPAQHPPHFLNGPSPNTFINKQPFAQNLNSTAWNQLKTPLLTSNSGSRKRSRDEISSPTDDADHGEYFQFSSSRNTLISKPVLQPIKEPVFGAGSTVNADAPFVEATSQTGAWAEEKPIATPNETHAGSFENSTPRLISRKSQRVESVTSISPFDALSGSSLGNSPPKAGPDAPIVDDFTHLLGIGWKRLSEDADLQSAARGWARYIENHYAISGARLLLRSEGLASYLVAAAEGFFLFHEDLGEGRLVARAEEQALANLSQRPVAFEGWEVLRPVESPKPEVVMAEAGERRMGAPLSGSLSGWAIADGPNVDAMDSQAMAMGPEHAGQEFAMDMD
jgi:hypothetical protein